MKPVCVVEVEVGIYAGFQVFHCFIAFKVVLALETSPKTLNYDVVQSPLFFVHADLDVVFFPCVNRLVFLSAVSTLNLLHFLCCFTRSFYWQFLEKNIKYLLNYENINGWNLFVFLFWGFFLLQLHGNWQIRCRKRKS